MTYNLTGIATNTTSFTTFVQGVNHHLMADLFGLLLIIAIMTVFILNFYFSTGDMSKSISGGLFIGTLLSILFSTLGILNPYYGSVIAIIWAISISLLIKRK